MGTALPAPLRAALAGFVAETGGGLAARAERLSRTYRAGETSQALTRPEDAAAYAAARLPATFAAASVALGELERLRPDLAPASLADFGCGPGSAALAAVEIFPSLAQVRLVDHNQVLLQAARRLFAASGAGDGRSLTVERRRIDDGQADAPPVDLAVAGYVLVELPEARAGEIAVSLLAAARQALVLVEPGTTAGFRRLRLAREALIATGATVLAPCTHALACPIEAPGWCHFSVRLARSRDHLRAKLASVPFEDEKFAYLVVTRGGDGPSGGRIVGAVRQNKAGLEFPLCADGKISAIEVSRGNPRFREIRRLDWGDPLAGPAEGPASAC